ncbi:MAG: NADH-quinone oxidoreductase subunit C [Gammaproteobacteria bacterium]|nr:NADH-quinone oxidoreductase subunit C [Gammaproteobacteria bacterium]
MAHDVSSGGGQLASLWTTSGDESGNHANVRAVFLINASVLIVTLPIVDDSLSYRGLETLFPSAVRMQRAAFDLTGIRSDAPDQRPWLRHAAWPAHWHPLKFPAMRSEIAAKSIDNYEFVRVEGDGVHEIPVGPVHAGIIEPGHFRFSIVGEKVLRLEERLGYVHKGIEHRFTELHLFEAHRLAARICGDSAVAFSWAYCQAAEGLTNVRVPQRGLYLRALALELERLQNHLGDLGALGNDAGFAFGLAQFSRIKEHLLRVINGALGQRYLFDWIVPGGTARDIDAASSNDLIAFAHEVASEVRHLRQIYEEHSGLRDRFSGAGRVEVQLASQLGLTGLAGRASGQSLDLRVDRPWPPYDQLAVTKCVRQEGDVAARVALRFDEVQETCVLIAKILRELPWGPVRVETPLPNVPGFAVGLIEGWRGPVLIALQNGGEGKISRCHAHDPSWHNWPVLEHAIIDNIVPDFPLINKSFNLAYSGHDL